MQAIVAAAIPWAVGLGLMLALCGLLLIGQICHRLLFPPDPRRQMRDNLMLLTLSRPQIKRRPPRLPNLPPGRNGRRPNSPMRHAISWRPRR